MRKKGILSGSAGNALPVLIQGRHQTKIHSELENRMYPGKMPREIPDESFLQPEILCKEGIRQRYIRNWKTECIQGRCPEKFRMKVFCSRKFSARKASDKDTFGTGKQNVSKEDAQRNSG